MTSASKKVYINNIYRIYIDYIFRWGQDITRKAKHQEVWKFLLPPTKPRKDWTVTWHMEKQITLRSRSLTE